MGNDAMKVQAEQVHQGYNVLRVLLLTCCTACKLPNVCCSSPTRASTACSEAPSTWGLTTSAALSCVGGSCSRPAISCSLSAKLLWLKFVSGGKSRIMAAV